MQKAAITTATRRIEIADVPEPEPGAEDAILKIDAVGVCGTDMHIFDGSFPADLPLIQGHEICASVEHLPTGYDGPLTLGERVAVMPVISCGHCYPCRIGRSNTCTSMRGIGVHRTGAFQERVAVPVSNVHSAAGLSSDAVALCETISVGHHAVTRAAIRPDDTVAILGAGPVGLATVIAAHDAGARVLVMDRESSRLEVAQRLGAEVVVEDSSTLGSAVADWTSGYGATLVVEATGVPAVTQMAFGIAGMAARIVMVGISEQPVELGMRVFTGKELDVYGARSTADFPAAVELVRRQEEAVRSLVTHRYSLEDAQEAVAWTLDNPRSVVKTVVEVS